MCGEDLLIALFAFPPARCRCSCRPVYGAGRGRGGEAVRATQGPSPLRATRSLPPPPPPPPVGVLWGAPGPKSGGPGGGCGGGGGVQRALTRLSLAGPMLPLSYPASAPLLSATPPLMDGMGRSLHAPDAMSLLAYTTNRLRGPPPPFLFSCPCTPHLPRCSAPGLRHLGVCVHTRRASK